VENLVSLLALLACPVGMGLMMRLMMRGNKDQAMGSMPAESPAADRPAADVDPAERLTALRAQLREVQARQGVVAEQIAGLSAEGRPMAPHDAAATAPLEPASPPVRPGEGNGAGPAKSPATGRPREEHRGSGA
jgi:hypothetical protein